MSTWGGAPEAGHGGLVGPGWLILGGDFRAGAGMNDDVGMRAAAFPMQAEVIGAAREDAFMLYAACRSEIPIGRSRSRSYASTT